jgi:hypothetical protein
MSGTWQVPDFHKSSFRSRSWASLSLRTEKGYARCWAYNSDFDSTTFGMDTAKLLDDVDTNRPFELQIVHGGA